MNCHILILRRPSVWLRGKCRWGPRKQPALRWPSWLRCRCRCRGTVAPRPRAPRGDVGFAGGELQPLSGMSSVLQRQAEPGGCAPGPRETASDSRPRLGGAAGPRGPGAALLQPSPRRLFPTKSERSMSDSGHLVHARAHTAAWGSAPQPRFDP